MPSHSTLDQRALEMDRLIAKRVQENPDLLTKARKNIARWLLTSSPAVRPVLLEWQAILTQSVSEILKVVTGTDEDSKRLRQSSPFCGILTPSERTAIILKYSQK